MRIFNFYFTFFVLVAQILQLSAINLPLKPATKPKIFPKISPPEVSFSSDYYHATCPDLEGIIRRKVQAWFNRDKTLAASIIRLHFHDCAVRGCDASILLNHRGSERRARASKTLRGYRVINEIKAEVERKCPRTVSCADILTAAARDATVVAGGPFWEVPFGRKDGRVSIGREANRLVPQGNENVTTLIKFFESVGLNVLDLVVLSGSHTIGRSSCSSIKHRLYNFNGSHGASASDPSLDRNYLKTLKQRCGPLSHYRDYSFVDLDATTPRAFDSEYYRNLPKKIGLLSTDQSLYSDKRTSSFVDTMISQPSVFSSQFAVSMVKLGNVGGC